MSKVAFKALLLDLDGVLWRGKEPIGDLPLTLQTAEEMGLRLAFVTNNATKSVAQYVEMFAQFGATVQPNQIFTSANATAAHLAKRFPGGGNVFIVGENGLLEALAEQGFETGTDDCLAVVVGLDRAISYEKLTEASLLIRGGAAFIGTNPDVTLPSPKGLAPGAGAIIAALEAASGHRAEIIGKPETALLEAALESLELRAEEALMVGDRLETDIAAGQKAGCATALVLSGASTRAQAERWEPQPVFVVEDLTALLGKLAHG
ncbi:MAG: HAD-IIA family hydrolase [Chloroflexi bacterium]|nr:HAD-IIA family hydrolase [Chloroflexota bacterium]